MTRPRVGTFLSLGSPEAAAVVGSRLDLVLVDAEHGPGDERTVLAQLRAASCPDGWVRVRRLEDAPKALDLGADGVVVPRIRSVDEVAELVRICAYPPAGVRGLGPSAANLYGTRMAEQLQAGSRHGELWPQIETLEAVESLAAILALDPGPTGVFVGPGDLSAALDHPGELGHPAVRAVVEHVVETVTAAGRRFAIFCPDPGDAQDWLGRGASVVVVGSDASWMAQGAGPTWALRDDLLAP